MSELDDLVRNRRFDEIHEARRQVVEDERSIHEAMATGQIRDGQAKRLYQRAVNAYVRELEYLLNPPDADEENQYWHTEPIGEIALPNGETYVVEGLGEYLELPEEMAVQVGTVERDHYYQLGETTAETVTVQPPWNVLRSAFRTANAAVTELGLELDVGESDDEWGFRKIEDVDEINPEEWNDLSVFENGHQNGEEASQ